MVYSGKTVKGKALYFETLDGLPLAIRLLRVPKHVAGRRHVSRIRPTFDSPGIVTDELGETVLDLDPVAIAAVALRFAIEYAQPGTAADRCRDVFDGADLKPYVAVACQMFDPFGAVIDPADQTAHYETFAERTTWL